MIVAIDGFSSCGKSTLARDIAKKLNCTYIDSGAMYRAITMYMLKNNISVHDEASISEMLHSIHLEFKNNHGVNEIYLNGENVSEKIRGKDVSDQVSPVSTIPKIRETLVFMQRKMSEGSRCIVMDGRDIGSVVFPNAEIKIFVTAIPEIRAKRRYLELKEKGISLTMQEVKANLLKRDEIDSTRAHSPLIKVADAFELDNSYLSREEQLDVVMEYIINHSPHFD